MPSDHPPTTSVRVEAAERFKEGKLEVWKPDGKGWRETPSRTLEKEIKMLGLRNA